jgi:hypothetical protein
LTRDGKLAHIGMTQKDRIANLDLDKLEIVATLKTGDGPDRMAWVGKP